MLIPKPWTRAVSVSNLSPPLDALKRSFPKPPNQDLTYPEGVWAATTLCSWGLCTACNSHKGEEPTNTVRISGCAQPAKPLRHTSSGNHQPYVFNGSVTKASMHCLHLLTAKPYIPKKIKKSQKTKGESPIKRFLSSYSETYIKLRLNYISILNCGVQ